MMMRTVFKEQSRSSFAKHSWRLTRRPPAPVAFQQPPRPHHPRSTASASLHTTIPRTTGQSLTLILSSRQRRLCSNKRLGLPLRSPHDLAEVAQQAGPHCSTSTSTPRRHSRLRSRIRESCHRPMELCCLPQPHLGVTVSPIRPNPRHRARRPPSHSPSIPTNPSLTTHSPSHLSRPTHLR